MNSFDHLLIIPLFLKWEFEFKFNYVLLTLLLYISLMNADNTKLYGNYYLLSNETGILGETHDEPTSYSILFHPNFYTMIYYKLFSLILNLVSYYLFYLIF